MTYKLFPESISAADKNALADCAKICRGNILTMTTLAGTGHPGGSMSSIEILLTLYKYANINPQNFGTGTQDNILVSIGHISPGVYSALAANGFFPADDAISQFRLAGSIYEGHIERTVNGVEWTTGNLGQGLSAACGMAVASKIKNINNFTYVLMGDGEQQKGQQAEARHFAAKYKLNNLIAIIDYNELQISGKISDVMPQDIEGEYLAAGWDVFHVNGHDYESFAITVREAQMTSAPAVIIAHTVMGKGISFMENRYKYHGATLTAEEYTKAMQELGLDDVLEKYKKLRKEAVIDLSLHKSPVCKITLPKAGDKFYSVHEKTDCRSAYGQTLEQLAKNSSPECPVIVFDCDLASSVKTSGVQKDFPSRFLQCGISEHHAASAAGSASIKGVIPFFSTFTMFAVDEVYNQLRMNDINHSNLKVVATHAGVDVGEDGRTHQCIDYLGLLRNLFNFKTVCPADPNQTVHAINFAAQNCGNVAVIMGRSKLPVITDDQGEAFFGEKYTFEYGNIDEVKKGEYPLVSYGTMLHRAVEAQEILAGDKISISVYNAATPIHLNERQIIKMAEKGIIFTLEDHIPNSGIYASICEIIARHAITCRVVSFGVRQYAYSGAPESVFKILGIDAKSVAEKIKETI